MKVLSKIQILEYRRLDNWIRYFNTKGSPERKFRNLTLSDGSTTHLYCGTIKTYRKSGFSYKTASGKIYEH